MAEFTENFLGLEAKVSSDLELYQMKTVTCAPGRTLKHDKSLVHSLYCITSGTGTLTIDNHSYELDNSCIIYIPNDIAAVFKASKSGPVEYSCCSFTGRRASGVKYAFMRTTPDKFILRGKDTSRFAVIIDKAVNLESETLPTYFRSTSLFYEFLSELSNTLELLNEDAEASNLAVRIKLQIEQRHAEKVQIQQIAYDMGIHPYYLSHVFKDTYGISPKKYLMDLKFSKAAGMLISTDMPVAAISSSLGFEDQLSFSKAFKKHFGVSPTDFRKSRK